MKKLNVVYDNEDAILKVKDESLIINTFDDEIIKIPYSNIKSYKYDDENEVVTINRYKGNSITFGVKYDKVLFMKLDNSSKYKISEPPRDSSSGKKEQAKTDSTSNSSSKKNYSLIYVVVFVVIVVIGIVIFASDGKSEYLSAKMKKCPNITLEQGLNNLKSFYNKYNVDFYYKLKKGKSSTGDEYMYLYLYNMDTVYDYNVYIPLELNNGNVSFNYVFSNRIDDQSMVGGAGTVEELLCGNYD